MQGGVEHLLPGGHRAPGGRHGGGQQQRDGRRQGEGERGEQQQQQALRVLVIARAGQARQVWGLRLVGDGYQ